MEIFQGKVQYFAGNSTVQHASYCGNPALKDSPFARAKYCKNNFNNLASSFVVLMELTVVNQWHDILLLARLPSLFGRTCKDLSPSPILPPSYTWQKLVCHQSKSKALDMYK